MLRKLDNQPSLCDGGGQGRGQDVIRIQEIICMLSFCGEQSWFGLCISCVSACFMIEAATSSAFDREICSLLQVRSIDPK
jgi:hypothetical protein